MNCNNCGKPNPRFAKVCSDCGYALGKKQQVYSSPYTQNKITNKNTQDETKNQIQNPSVILLSLIIALISLGVGIFLALGA